MNMFDFLYEPWPWYVSGPLIGLSVPLLLMIGNKALGISSSLRHICAAVAPANIPFLKYHWKSEVWNLFFALGILLGGFLAGNIFANPHPISLSEQALKSVSELAPIENKGLIPEEVFNWGHLFTWHGFLVMVGGGFMIGFGSRYAGGCTSGHAIMGISTLQWPSLVAVISFFIGGLLMTYFIAPFIYSLY